MASTSFTEKQGRKMRPPFSYCTAFPRPGDDREPHSDDGGNFRLLARLLTHIERVLSVNDLHLVSNADVEAAREGLVLGPR
jgi:hypothetical protein